LKGLFISGGLLSPWSHLAGLDQSVVPVAAL